MAIQDDLQLVANDLDQAKADVEAVVADLSSTGPSAADNVLAAVVAALEAEGYTVTPPAPADVPTDVPAVTDVPPETSPEVPAEVPAVGSEASA